MILQRISPFGRTTKSITLLGLGLAIAVGCSTPQLGDAGPVVQREQVELNLLPQPLSVLLGPGSFDIERSHIAVDRDIHSLELPVIDHLRKALLPYRSTETGDDGDKGPSHPIRLTLGGDTELLGNEGYRLQITNEEVALVAPTAVGLLHGIQTLTQLVQEARQPSLTAWLPCVEIMDRPRFAWRGQLLDVSRHFQPIDVVRRNLDRLAELKMNVFHWHLVDDQGWRIESLLYPKLASVGAWRVDRNAEAWWGRAEAQPGEVATYGGFYTQAELRELVEYAAMRGITIVPEVDVPGHSRALIAAYPELSCDGVQRAVATGGIADTNTLCPGKETTFEFLEGMLAEVAGLFPSEYFHIGGDECNKRAWGACKDCAARMQAEGLADVNELQSYFIRRCEQILIANGKRLIGWDEILEGGLAPNAAVMSWRGEAGGITSARAGHEVVMSPNSSAYLDLKQGDPDTEPPLGYSQLFLRTSYEYDPIPGDLTEHEGKLVLGFQGNLWGESIQHEDHLTYMLLPRLYAIAEGGWSHSKHRDWDGFVRRVEAAIARDGATRSDRGASVPAQADDPLEPYYARNSHGTVYSPAMYQVAFDVDHSGPNLAVHLSTEHGTVAIRWTDDGSEPDMDSALYTKPLHFIRTTTLRAAAFRDRARLGRISTRRIQLHLALGAGIDLSVPSNARYPGGGAPGLVDGRRASASHLDKRWLGFQVGEFTATVDLGEVQPIHSVTLDCLEAQNSWIFLPAELHLELSLDGEQYTPAAHLEFDASTRSDGEERAHALRLTLDTAITARYIRLTAHSVGALPAWHQGAGGQPWIFADELVIE